MDSSINNIPNIDYTQYEPAIDTLKQQYRNYVSMMIANKSAKEDLDFQEMARTRKELEQIGDQMFYDNPYIWLRYKIEAYAKGVVSDIAGIEKVADSLTKPITTWGELIEHSCRTPRYICGNRFHFMLLRLLELNAMNEKANLLRLHSPKEMDSVDRSLFDFLFDPSMELAKIFEDPMFIQLMNDETFLKKWYTFEHETIEVQANLFEVDLDLSAGKMTESRVNKWGSYGVSNEF